MTLPKKVSDFFYVNSVTAKYAENLHIWKIYTGVQDDKKDRDRRQNTGDFSPVLSDSHGQPSFSSYFSRNLRHGIICARLLPRSLFPQSENLPFSVNWNLIGLFVLLFYHIYESFSSKSAVYKPQLMSIKPKLNVHLWDKKLSK